MRHFTKRNVNVGVVRRCVTIPAVVALWACLLNAPVFADDWMFERSYYTHVLPPEVQSEYPRPVSRSAYRRAYVGLKPGFAARGGYRFIVSRIRSGDSIDTTVTRENWFELWP